MKKVLVFIVMGVIFLFTACSTLKVDVDYDSSFNFMNKTKYTVLYKVHKGENTLVNDRIKSAIVNFLNTKNYTEVSKDKADLVFVFHTNVMTKSDLRTDYEVIGYGGYGYAPGWGRGAWGYSPTVVIPRSTTYKWKEGKLIIDAMNPVTKKIVWRGIAKDELRGRSTTQKEKTVYINNVVVKLMKEFPLTHP